MSFDSRGPRRDTACVNGASLERTPVLRTATRKNTYPPLPMAPSSCTKLQVRRETAPPAPGYDVAGHHIPGRDLTGLVRKKSNYYFATGGFADLWEGELREAEGSDVRSWRVAVKILRSLNSVYPESNVERLGRSLGREALVWGKLKHPNITPFLGFCDDLGQPAVPSLVSPFYKHGNIISYLMKDDSRRRDSVLKLLAQITAGLVYLHGQSPVVIHGDIKGSNVLIDDDGNARLADFGLSRILGSTGLTTKSVAGSCRWMAFELMCSSDPEEEDTFTTATDVWATGMTIVEILTGKPPFAEHKYDAGVIIGLANGDRPIRPSTSLVDDTMWTVIQSTWRKEPWSRPPVCNVSLIIDLIYYRAEEEREKGAVYTPLSPEHVSTILSERTETPAVVQGFPCKWANCDQSFPTLDICCKHEFSFHKSWPASLQSVLLPLSYPGVDQGMTNTTQRRRA